MYNKCILLCDSLGKDLYLHRTRVVSKPGAKIEDLTRKVWEGSIFISSYKVILVLIGTCNISHKQAWKDYQLQKKQGIENPVLLDFPLIPLGEFRENYKKLVSTIRLYNREAQLCLCAIPPRVYDFYQNMNHLKAINNIIKDITETTPDSQYINSAKIFIKQNNIKEEDFCDGIHLSQKGNRRLTSLLNSQIGLLC